MNIAIGRSGMRFCEVASLWDSVAECFSSHELRTELVLDDNNSNFFYKVLADRVRKLETK